MKQSYDSFDDYKFPITTNETLSEKTANFINLVTINVCDRVRTPANSDKAIFSFNFVVLCNDNNVIIFYAYGC